MQHTVQLEVGLDLGFVECIVGFAHLLGVVLPIPRREPEAALLAIDQRLHLAGFGPGLGRCRRHEIGQQLDGGLGRLGHLVFEGVRRVVGKPEQPGAFGAQLRQPHDVVPGIVGIAVLRPLRGGHE